LGEKLWQTVGLIAMGKQPASLQHIRTSSQVGRRKPLKYRNIKVTYEGINFDSKRERDRYIELRLLENAGEITDLQVQPKMWLRCGGVDVKSKKGRILSYSADFLYIMDGDEVYEDVKGMMTPVAALKIAMVEAEYGIEIKIVR